jgi:putative peptidoglycan lipid II flippase
VREQVFAAFFGAGAATDAFQIAFRIPNLLRDLFAEGAMSAAFVPTYARVRRVDGEKTGWLLLANAANFLFLATSCLALLGVLFADPLVSLIAPAFSLVPGKHEMTVAMTRILWPFLPLVVMAALWMGVLNARDRYAVPALAPSLFNLASIAAAFTLCPLGFWAFGWPPIYGMALGALVGGLLQWVFQIPALRREGFRHAWTFRFSDPGLQRVILLMGIGTFGLAATQINVMVNSVLAASQGNGAVSWLNYAFRLMQFPLGVFGVAISTANLTKVAREAAEGDLSAVGESVTQALRMVIVLSIPSSVGLAILGMPIVSLIYQHGRFLANDSYSTSLALAGYALGLTAYAGVKVLVPVLYSLGRARATVWSSGGAVAVNTILGLLLLGRFGFVGLSFATSLAAIANFSILFWLSRRVVKQIDFKDLALCFVAALFSSLFMAIIVYIGQWWVGILPFHPIPLTGIWVNATFLQHLFFLAIALGAAVVVYCLIGRILGLREIQQIQRIVWKR